MFTKNEITSINLSPTKKDFVQIWNELLDVASKLSERWDPTSTNESDPGIVILKAITGIADKLNYNIDKNILEAFMPTAAQEESMRNLCEMLGYNVKYYQSAQTNVTIKYHNPDPAETEEETALMNSTGVYIPKFTVIKNSDQDISYFTTNQQDYFITSMSPTLTVPCMEGQIVKCEGINSDNVITINQISNNRFYLPEAHIAENGIFIYNVFNSHQTTDNSLYDGILWEKVDNLNIQERGSRVYKFGYDSYESCPYIEFPEDYSELFDEGIFIYYTRTSGVSGNVSARTLTQLVFPNTTGWDKISEDSFSVENSFASTNGAEIETIEKAYSNFKKTIGTFETLVTCRDYMNKICTLVDDSGRPYVSNILVSDIRSDLNDALTICSCDNYGIFYKETPIRKRVFNDNVESVKITELLETKPVFDGSTWRLGSRTGMELPSALHLFIDNVYQDESTGMTSCDFDYNAPGDVYPVFKKQSGEIVTNTKDLTTAELLSCKAYWAIEQENTRYITCLKSTNIEPTSSATEDEYEQAIDYFDLMLYPFKTYSQIKGRGKDIKSIYNKSFTYSNANYNQIVSHIKKDYQTIAHNFKQPSSGDILSINNYLRINVTVATNYKVAVEECDEIKEYIKIALANAFNMGELDFGEEIPFDSIVRVIENADSRIKVASLNDPSLYTTYSVLDNEADGKIVEYAVASEWLSDSDAKNIKSLTTTTSEGETISTFNTTTAKEKYNYLAVRNVLAGRLPLFKYNTKFIPSFFESVYQDVTILTTKPSDLKEPDADTPFTICYKDGEVFTGQYFPNNQDRTKDRYEYKKFTTPELYSDGIIDNIADDYITDITPNLTVTPDTENGSTITKVKLQEGEVIKFRAPNFITTKTYPAYVNYHLELDTEVTSRSISANAKTLFDILDEDRLTWSASNQNIRWQKVLDYFGNLDATNAATGEENQLIYKHRLEPKIKVSKFSPAASTGEELGDCTAHADGNHVEEGSTGKCACGATIMSNVQAGAIDIEISNDTEDDEISKLEALLASSGCVKLVDTVIEWAPSANDTKPKTDAPELEFNLSLDNPFITDIAMLHQILDSTKQAINEQVGKTDASGNPKLPSECGWTFCFIFEGVPFSAASLAEWEKFVRLDTSQELLGFKPVEEHGVIFWRTYDEGYSIGRYVLKDTSKLLEVNGSYFGLLGDTPTKKVYLASSLGKDAEQNILKNDTEYQLGPREYLYIEYTPSSIDEDGTTTTGASITEIHGPGTIIRPSGFEGDGLVDSTVRRQNGNTPHKTVTFISPDKNPIDVEMYSFGANEQIEIRDFARVIIDKDSFKTSSGLYVYKNFVGCDELEKNTQGALEREYTLKDGECIFYTDINKNEFAYYTTGTKVKLVGSVSMPKGSTDLDLVSILDSDPKDIPWDFVPLSNNDEIIFQEYQYIVLSKDDTLDNLVLTEPGELDSSTWKYCNAAAYTLAGDEVSVDIPEIRVDFSTNDGTNVGCGWEVTSALSFSASPDNTQTLRNTDKLVSSITLSNTSSGGGGSTATQTIYPEVDSDIVIKTNLPCQTENSINISDITDEVKGFEIKVFSQDEPAIVKTAPGKVVPYIDLNNPQSIDINNWVGEPVLIENKAFVTLDINKIAEASNEVFYDSALRLPIIVLPNTYGIFSIYVNDNENSSDQVANTWIEVMTDKNSTDSNMLSLSLINIAEEDVADLWVAGNSDSMIPDKLFLKPGINCVRVNKSCKLFIKTSSTSKGTVSFDSLRLVNTELLDYKEANGQITTVPTYGLNFDQLDYINMSDPVLDVDTSNKLKETYIADVQNVLLDKINKLQKDFETAHKDIVKVLPEALNLLSYINNIIEDFDKIGNAYAEDSAEFTSLNNDLLELITVYKRVYTLYEKEDALLNTLNSDENSSELVQKQLVALLDSLSNEGLKQQLLDKLDELYNKNTISIEQLSKEDILKDITSYFNQSTYSTNVENEEMQKNVSEAFTKIKETVDSKVKTEFFEQISAIIDEFDADMNSEERVKLLASLNKLKASLDNEHHVAIANEINKLINSADTSTLETLFSDIAKCSSLPDYSELVSSLHQLYAFLKSKDLSYLISEIVKASEEYNSSNLSNQLKVLESLTSTPGGGGTAGALRPLWVMVQNVLHDANIEPTHQELLHAITELITATNKSIADGDIEVNSSLATKLNILITNVRKYYDKQLSDCLTSINEEINSLDDEIKDIINFTTGSSDAAARAISNKLYELITHRNMCLSLLVPEGETDSGLAQLTSIDIAQPSYDESTFLSNFYCKDYIKEAIYEIWPTYLFNRVQYAVKHVHNYLEAVIASAAPKVVNFDDYLNSLFITDAAKNLVMYSEYETFFNTDIEYFINNFIQLTTNASLVNTISSYIPDTSDLLNAKQDFLNSVSRPDQNRKQVISDLLTKLSDDTKINSASERHEVTSKLIDELTAAKKIDGQLVAILEKLLFPTIVDIEQYIANNEFYKNLLSRIEVLKTSILTMQFTNNVTTQNQNARIIIDPNVGSGDGSSTEPDDTPDSSEQPENVEILIYPTNLFKDLSGELRSYKEDIDTILKVFYDDEAIDIESVKTNLELFVNGVIQEILSKNILLPDSFVDVLTELVYVYNLQNYLNNDILAPYFTNVSVDEFDLESVKTINVKGLPSVLGVSIVKLITSWEDLDRQLNETISEENRKTVAVLQLERQLLNEIRVLDTNRDFYYNVPVEHSFAIDFNEKLEDYNTLASPRVNYDVNNINNSFVISKLDIDYLDDGITIARSSRLN